MVAFPTNPTPARITQAYNEGYTGWIWTPESEREWDEFCGSMPDADDRLANIAGTHKSVPRATLYRSRMKYDPKAFGEEAQDTGDCVAHGSRNSRDITRSVEIHIKKEPEDYFKRSAVEPNYGMRGGMGEGMNPATSAKFDRDYGFVFREQYPEADLRKYNPSLEISWGRRGTPASVKELCKQHNVGQLIIPKTIEQCLDLFANGYACHSGQGWGCSSSTPSDGINRRRGGWNHDMCSGGYDISNEFFKSEVFFVMQTWGAWNQTNPIMKANQDVYYEGGQYPTGIIVVPFDEWESEFLKSGSIYFYADIKGVPAKKLPNYGAQQVLA